MGRDTGDAEVRIDDKARMATVVDIADRRDVYRT
jgi:hypothetical protein